jgi:hypothetical protein
MKSGQPCTKGLKFKYSQNTSSCNLFKYAPKRGSNEEAYSDEDKQGERDTNSITCINTYTACRHPESEEVILAKGKS